MQINQQVAPEGATCPYVVSSTRTVSPRTIGCQSIVSGVILLACKRPPHPKAQIVDGRQLIVVKATATDAFLKGWVMALAPDRSCQDRPAKKE